MYIGTKLRLSNLLKPFEIKLKITGRKRIAKDRQCHSIYPYVYSKNRHWYTMHALHLSKSYVLINLRI